MAKRVLITGAAGFVGANLARHLLERGDQVSLAVRPGGDRWRLEGLEGEAEVIESDLCERDSAERLIAAARPDSVMHLAAHGAYSWQTDPERIFETNALATLRLLRACADAGVIRLIHAGSSSEYGYKDHPPSEDELPEPNSDYAVAKLAATLCCAYFGRETDLQTATLRLYSAYGPWEEPRRLVPTLVRAALEGELPPLVEPEIARDFVYVDDVCAAFAAVADREHLPTGAIYNIAAGRQVTIREIVDIARSVFGVEAEPEWGTMENRAWDTGAWVGDPSRIRAELGWEPVVDLESGLRLTGEWLSARPGPA